MSHRPERRVSVSGGFWLLLGWFVWGCGWRPLLWILAASAAHEAGHYLFLRAFGAEVRTLRVHILGAVMEADTSRLSYGQELMAVLAGPGANFLCAVAAALLGDLWTFCGANVVLCLFNLLPLQPLDGGRALYLLLSWRFGTAVGERICTWIGALCGLFLGTALCLIPVWSGGSLWLLPTAMGLFGAAIALWKKK